MYTYKMPIHVFIYIYIYILYKLESNPGDFLNESGLRKDFRRILGRQSASLSVGTLLGPHLRYCLRWHL